VFAVALIALAVPAVAPAQQFGIFTVDTVADGNDGECNNDCTIREAIALAPPGQQAIVTVPAGVYRLTLGPLVLNNAFLAGAGLSGGQGASARTTIIDARGRSRVIEVPSGGNSLVAGLTLTGGTATTGAGVFIGAEGVLNLYNVHVQGNTAGARGGGIHNQGIVSLQNSAVLGNRVNDGSGGGIAGDTGSDTRILTSTISGNSATSTGGGIYNAGAAIVAATTVAGNSAGSGGGIFQESVAGSSVSMWNTIVASGASGGACGGPVVSPGTTQGGNLSNDATCNFAPGQGVNSVDPLLGPVANNGGSTDTRALREGSPAIDAGDPQLCGVTATDQRFAQFVGNCDIGAFEFGGVPPQPQLPPPVAGETVNVSEARGIVKVKLPGSDRFFDLEDAQQVPIGSTFNTNRGRVNLIAAGQQRSWFYQGTFRLGQTHGARPLSTLTLTGALSCGRGANIAAKKKRRLWGDGKGKFRTKGKHSAATVVGTRWLVEDRCNGTLTRVVKGRVRVRDFRARRTVVVKARKQYFARAR
jgi:CSLREA domain-containing protein